MNSLYSKENKLLIIALSLFSVACSNSAESTAEGNDTAEVQAAPTIAFDASKTIQLGELKLGLSAGLENDSEKNSNSGDTLFLRIAEEALTEDQEFVILSNTYDDLIIEQQEQQSLYISRDGTICDPAPEMNYRSKWYYLPYYYEQKFRFISYKDEDDIPYLELDTAKVIESAILNCGELMKEYIELAKANGNHEFIQSTITGYLLRLTTKKGEQTKVYYIQVSNNPVGC